MSMIFVASITLVGKIFKGNQRSLCMSIYGTVVPVAGIFYPYLLEYLTNKYDLNGALLVISGIFCHGYIFSIILWFRRHELIIKTENSAEHVEHRHENVSLCMKLSNFIKQMVSVRFACLLGATALSVSSLNGFLTFAFDIAKWKGFQDSNANLLFIIYTIYNSQFICLFIKHYTRNINEVYRCRYIFLCIWILSPSNSRGNFATFCWNICYICSRSSTIWISRVRSFICFYHLRKPTLFRTGRCGSRNFADDIWSSFNLHRTYFR